MSFSWKKWLQNISLYAAGLLASLSLIGEESLSDLFMATLLCLRHLLKIPATSHTHMCPIFQPDSQMWYICSTWGNSRHSWDLHSPLQTPNWMPSISTRQIYRGFIRKCPLSSNWHGECHVSCAGGKAVIPFSARKGDSRPSSVTAVLLPASEFSIEEQHGRATHTSWSNDVTQIRMALTCPCSGNHGEGTWGSGGFARFHPKPQM